jgi:hypothetical protein
VAKGKTPAVPGIKKKAASAKAAGVRGGFAGRTSVHGLGRSGIALPGLSDAAMGFGKGGGAAAGSFAGGGGGSDTYGRAVTPPPQSQADWGGFTESTSWGGAAISGNPNLGTSGGRATSAPGGGGGGGLVRDNASSTPDTVLAQTIIDQYGSLQAAHDAGHTLFGSGTLRPPSQPVTQPASQPSGGSDIYNSDLAPSILESRVKK